ncbi:MAG: hypothetical protein OEZ36_06205 [Spirochaetota bacterium]|nr:hypothetical protein [Spirochaetota bacterium]
MKTTMEEVLKGLECDYAEIRIEEKMTTSIRYSGKELEDIGNRTEKGGNVRICHKGGWSFVSFNSLDNMKEKAELCLKQATLVGKGESRLRKISAIDKTYKSQYKIDPRTVPLNEKEELCRNANDKILSEPIQ